MGVGSERVLFLEFYFGSFLYGILMAITSSARDSREIEARHQNAYTFNSQGTIVFPEKKSSYYERRSSAAALKILTKEIHSTNYIEAHSTIAFWISDPSSIKHHIPREEAPSTPGFSHQHTRRAVALRKNGGYNRLNLPPPIQNTPHNQHRQIFRDRSISPNLPHPRKKPP